MISSIRESISTTRSSSPNFPVSGVSGVSLSYYGQFAPQLLKTRYAKEIWLLYEDGKLTPETPLTGKFVEEERVVDMDSLMDEIIRGSEVTRCLFLLMQLLFVALTAGALALVIFIFCRDDLIHQRIHIGSGCSMKMASSPRKRRLPGSLWKRNA